MQKILFIIIILLFQISCKKDDTLSSFALNNQKIEDSNENLNIKNESFLEAIYIQAEKNDDLIPRKETAKKVHAIGIDLYKYIEDLKLSIKDKNSIEYVNELFFNGNEITREGEEFLMYVKNYRDSMNEVLGDNHPRILGMVNNIFDLSVIEDRRGQKTNWLTLNFKDFSPIISITKLSSMQSDIRRIETQFLAELLGVKLDNKVKKLVDKIKSEVNKEIAETNSSKESTTESTTESINKDNTDIVDNNISTEKEEVTSNKELIVNPEDIKVEQIKEEPKKVVVKAPKKVIESTKKYHTVKSGENVYRIALKYKMSIARLKKINGMKNNNIRVGQKLLVE